MRKGGGLIFPEGRLSVAESDAVLYTLLAPDGRNAYTRSIGTCSGDLAPFPILHICAARGSRHPHIINKRIILIARASAHFQFLYKKTKQKKINWLYI